jgi:hypothetical protein
LLGLSAWARTPWVQRFGSLADVHPEVLLGEAIAAATKRAGLEVSDCSLLMVACDSPVGAQASNLARRVALLHDAPHLTALTVDGQGVADLALVGQAALLGGGPVIVAGVDSTSIVAPGAALVRDYGRPTTTDVTEASFMEAQARAAAMTTAGLDEAARVMAQTTAPTSGAHIVSVRVGRGEVTSDNPSERPPTRGLLPLTDGGVVTAAHTASLADGAAAVVLANGPGRPVSSADLTAGAADSIGDALVLACHDAAAPIALAERSAVLHEIVRASGVGFLDGVNAVLALGSVPSADGLRMLIDAAEATSDGFTVIGRGRGGQIASVTIGS